MEEDQFYFLEPLDYIATFEGVELWICPEEVEGMTEDDLPGREVVEV